jgi:hypothetical protein
MSFKGANYRMDQETISEGIDGSSSISSIKNGYVLDAINVDLSKPGQVQKRAGYHLHGQRLPIRAKRVEQSGTNHRVLLDVIPKESINVLLYANTSFNESATNNSIFFRADDSDNTIFATFSSTEEITTDTVLSCYGTDNLEHFVQPIEVFSGTGIVKILLPLYVKNWFGIGALSDTLGVNAAFYRSNGKTFASLKESYILGLSLIDDSPFTIRIEYAVDAANPLTVGSSVMFETAVRQANGDAVTGVVVAGNETYSDIVINETIAYPLGVIEHDYFCMRYINAKHILVSGDTDLTTVGPYIINDCSSVTTSSALGTGPTILFLYGLCISAGPVNILGKYYNTNDELERTVCGVDGYLFKEVDDYRTISTIDGLVYSGALDTIQANQTTKTFTIPLSGADDVYEIGDVVIVQYAEGTTSNWRTNTRIITTQFTVKEVTPTSIIVDSNNERSFILRPGMRFRFERTGTVIRIQNPSFPLTSGMTVQYGVRSKVTQTYEVIDCDYSGAVKTITLDTPLTWDSDNAFVLGPTFAVVDNHTCCTYATDPGTRIETSTVSMERSTVIACGLSGIWRFNGDQLINMRIPRVGSGFIRNVPGTAGHLKLDVQEDGSKIGRRYDFVVTYSYQELVDGKLITYESGKNATSVYSILSETDDLNSGLSKVVELQVPTIPRGIGLPAEDMFINVYRTPSGTQITEPSAEFYLLERQVKNNPDTAFITVIAGTEAPFVFTPTSYKIYAGSVQTEGETDDLRSEVIDPPLSSIVSTLENRILAANGFDHPQIHFICNEAYNPQTNEFSAPYEIVLAGRQATDPSYMLYSAPCTIDDANMTNGGLNSIPYQIAQVDSYLIKKVTYEDWSHRFDCTGATFTDGKQYLVRLANGIKEALTPGTTDAYYDGWDHIGQVFLGTSTATRLEAQKKWTRKTAAGIVIPPTEQFLVWEKLGEVTAPSTSNGLIIVGNTALDAGGGPTFHFYSTVISLSIGQFIIFRGLGTTGQIRNRNTEQLSFDRDLVFRVKTGSSPYELEPLIMGNSLYSHFANANILTAISVSNAATGVTTPSFSVFRMLAGSPFATTGWTVSPKTASIQLTTSPVISPQAGDYVSIDGLPSEVPMGTGFAYNGGREVVSFSGDTFVIKVTPPETAKGDLSQDFTAATRKGNLVWTKGIVIPSTQALQLVIKHLVLTSPLTAGDWIFICMRGESPDSYCLALTGHFKTLRFYDGASWVNSLAAGSTLQRIEIEYRGELDFPSLTGASKTRILLGNTVSHTIRIPVPVLPMRDGSKDLTGTLYSTIDGYTPYERVIKPLAHALNSVFWNYGFAYWGGRAIGKTDDNTHPGNIIPTNGVKFMPHLFPEDKTIYRYFSGTLTDSMVEPQWKCKMAANKWRVEGSVIKDVANTTEFTLTTAYGYRPSRLWYTNSTGTLVGQSFRELMFDDIESQDGERIAGMAPFQSYSILAKTNSLWKISFGNSNKMSRVKIPGIVGASSHANMVQTDRGVLFLHETGVYISDGTTTEPIHQLRRHFDDFCSQNNLLFPLTSGFHDSLNKKVYIGVPVSETNTELAGTIDGQFVFDYTSKNISLDSITRGWSMNRGFEATHWLGIYNDIFFSDVYGNVQRIRTERGPTRWRDGNRAIQMSLKTRFMLAESAVDGRFMKSLIFQFGKQTSVNMDVSMAWEYFGSYDNVVEYRISKEGWGLFPFGTSSFGGDKMIETIRRTPEVMRVYRMSLKFEDNALDSSGAIHNITLQSEQISPNMIEQKGQKR